MAPQNQSQHSFDPSRDVPQFGDAYLRQYGLNSGGSRPFYKDLARLAAPGALTLRFQSWTELSDALIRLRGDDRGLRHKKRIDEKLAQLCKQGLIDCVERDGYEVTFRPPDQWQPRETPEREREFKCLSSEERQGSLFEESATRSYRLFGGVDDSAETESAFGFQESASCEKPKALSVLNSAGSTSYTRVRAVDDEVEDEDDVDSGEGLDFENPDATPPGGSTAAESVDVTEEQLDLAIDALQTIVGKLNRHRVGLPRPPEHEREQNRPHESNFSMVLRAHVAVQLGRLTQDWFWGGVEAVLCERQKKAVKNAFAFIWTDWKKQRPDAGRVFSSRRIRLPPGWYERARGAFRRPERAPNGEQPQRE
jgi:hypothetical protein